MPAPEAIQQLVENFATHIEHYKSAGYNETELRREYLDPFRKALGSDIDKASRRGHFLTFVVFSNQIFENFG